MLGSSDNDMLNGLLFVHVKRFVKCLGCETVKSSIVLQQELVVTFSKDVAERRNLSLVKMLKQTFQTEALEVDCNECYNKQASRETRLEIEAAPDALTIYTK